MPPLNWKKHTASALIAAAIILCLSVNAKAAERIIVLAPAAADILSRLGAGEQVVGVTASVTEFPAATVVGTHLNPGIEKMASLRPTLIVSSGRFDPDAARRMGADLFVYEPKTLETILENIRQLAGKMGLEEQGERLVADLEGILAGLTPPEQMLTVLYETRSTPVSLAKKNTIILSILEHAGMRYAYPDSTGSVSSEYLMAHQPDVYIYQQGPMNRDPVPPQQRPGWEGLRACVWKVEEFDFARPNTRLFQTVRDINEILNSNNVCRSGIQAYPETAPAALNNL